MNYQNMSDGRPLYLDRCQEMDFNRLLEFIEDSLARLLESNPEAARPRSEEEFRHLVQLLRELQDTPPVSPVPLSYQPSRELRNKTDKLERLDKHLDESYGEPSTRKKDIYQMLRRRTALEEEIAKLRVDDRRSHSTRLSAYQNYTNSAQTRAVNRIGKAVDRAFRPQPTGRFQWQPLPPGEAAPENVHWHYHEKLRREGRLDKFNQERLDKALDLPYAEWWVPTEGFGGFDSYSIFSFDHTEKVLLECPLYGNAAYIVNSSEERWKDMTKQELIDSGEAEKVAHQGENWHVKVREALEVE